MPSLHVLAYYGGGDCLVIQYRQVDRHILVVAQVVPIAVVPCLLHEIAIYGAAADAAVCVLLVAVGCCSSLRRLLRVAVDTSGGAGGVPVVCASTHVLLRVSPVSGQLAPKVFVAGTGPPGPAVPVLGVAVVALRRLVCCMRVG